MKTTISLLDGFFAFLRIVFNFFDTIVDFITYVTSPEVRVGFVTDINPSKHNGTAFLDTPRGRVVRHFTVDRPENLDEPPAATVRSIFDQIKSMGFEASEIEIKSQRERRVYRNGDDQPLLTQLI